MRKREGAEPWVGGQRCRCRCQDDEGLTVRRRKLDEAAALRAAILLHHDVGVQHGADLLAQVLQVLPSRVVRKVAHVHRRGAAAPAAALAAAAAARRVAVLSHEDIAAVDLCVVKLVDSPVGIFCVLKSHKPAPLGAAIRLLHHVSVQHRPDSLEMILEVLPAHCPRQVADVDVLAAAALAAAAESATLTTTAAAAFAVWTRSRATLALIASPNGPTAALDGFFKAEVHRVTSGRAARESAASVLPRSLGCRPDFEVQTKRAKWRSPRALLAHKDARAVSATEYSLWK